MAKTIWKKDRRQKNKDMGHQQNTRTSQTQKTKALAMWTPIKTGGDIWDSYSDFLNRAKTLSQKLLGQGYVQPLLVSSLQKLYGGHHDIIERYEVSVSQMRIDIYGAGHAYPSEAPDVTPGFMGVHH
jgi:hypothetical protein